MGRRGPAPKPSALRLIEGTDSKGRSGRQLDRSKEPVAPEGDLAPPYKLTAEAQQVWDRTVIDLTDMGLASPADARAIAAYCEACVIHQRATELIAGSSILLKGDRTLVVNKAVTVQREAANQILRFSQEFGLTPAARTRVEVTSRGLGQRSTGVNPFA